MPRTLGQVHANLLDFVNQERELISKFQTYEISRAR